MIRIRCYYGVDYRRPYERCSFPVKQLEHFYALVLANSDEAGLVPQRAGSIIDLPTRRWQERELVDVDAVDNARLSYT